jgi:hypothetical protein
MVIIKTTCPSCGEVDLTADKVELRIAIGGRGTSYAFNCPRCDDRVRKPADSRVVQLLISGGIAPEVVADDDDNSASREMHPSRGTRSAAPTITYDDLLEFHKELESGVLESFLKSTAA